MPNPYGFSTKEFSSATGLAYFGARYYNPQVGRWLSQDPLGMVNGPNMYAYCGNNPTNLIDPWGLETNASGGDAGDGKCPEGEQKPTKPDENGLIPAWVGIVGGVVGGIGMGLGLVLLSTTAPIWVPVTIFAGGLALTFWSIVDTELSDVLKAKWKARWERYLRQADDDRASLSY